MTFDGAKSQFGIQTDIFKHNNNLSPQYNYFGGNALFEQIKAQQQQQQEQQQVFGNILNGSFAHLNNAQDGKPTTNKPGFNFFLSTYKFYFTFVIALLFPNFLQFYCH